MFDFKAPQDDILFSLVHVADAARIASWDSDMATDIIGHFSNLAEGVIAPLNASGDAQGARLEQGRVRMPDGFKNAYQQLADDGWQGLTAPDSFGGMGVSPAIANRDSSAGAHRHDETSRSIGAAECRVRMWGGAQIVSPRQSR